MAVSLTCFSNRSMQRADMHSRHWTQLLRSSNRLSTSNPTGKPFNPMIFDVYNPWADLNGQGGGAVAARRAIARGQQVFNSVAINITGVAGLNDLLNQPSIAGFCGTCHDTPNSGNHSVKAPLNIGVADAGAL